MSGEGPPAFDSRRWTGPASSPPAFDRRATRAAFLAAGGRGAAAPQRAAEAVSWAGLALLPLVALPGADEPAWGPESAAARLRGGSEGWLAPTLGPRNTEGMLDVLGDAQFLALLLALAGTLAGGISAWRHRAALARGFAAVEARTPGAVFTTRRGDLFVPLLVLFAGGQSSGNHPLRLLDAPALWFAARLMAGALTAAAERRVAGSGVRTSAPSGWDQAHLAAALGALLLMLGHAARAFG